MRSTARFTARFPNSEAVLLVLLVNHVFFSSELSQFSQSTQTSDLLTIENAVCVGVGVALPEALPANNP